MRESLGSRGWTTLGFGTLAAFAIVCGAAFRFTGLGAKIYSHDEAYTSLRAAGYDANDVFAAVWDAQDRRIDEVRRFLEPGADRTISHTVSSLALEPHQGPLFFILEHYWMRFAGYSPAAMRALAAIIGLLAVPAMYWFATEQFRSFTAAVLSTLFLATSPYYILFSQDARPYSLLVLTTLLSSAALLRALRCNTVRSWIAYALTLILGIYSHELFAMVAMAHAVYFAWITIDRIRQRDVPIRQSLAGFLSASLVAVVAWWPWLSLLLRRRDRAAALMEWANVQVSWSQYIRNWLTIWSSPFIDFPLPIPELAYLLRALVLGFIAIALVSVARHCTVSRWLLPALVFIGFGAVLLLPDLIHGGIRSTSGRYYAAALIFTIVGVSCFLAIRLHSGLATDRRNAMVLVSVLLFGQIASDVRSLRAPSWWNKRLSAINVDFVRTVNQDDVLLIVTNNRPTTLGDILLLSLEVDRDMHIRLQGEAGTDPAADSGRRVYWFANAPEEVAESMAAHNFRTTRLAPNLWRIEADD